jgi:hypothetical protein
MVERGKLNGDWKDFEEFGNLGAEFREGEVA